MSTQNRNSGGGGTARNQKKSNANSSGIGGTETNAHAATNHKKSDVTKTEKEKVQPKPTPEQLRIAQITNSNAAEDPQMQEKVATLIEMTQRSEEEVCCALYECDNNMELAVVFLFETLPVGAFETSSKKKKKQAAAVSGQDGTGVISDGNDGWNDGPIHSSSDKHEKSRNRSSNRGGRGGTDSRGWRGREARENERNLRESRSSGFGGGYNSGERGDREDRANREDRGPRCSGMSRRSGEGGSGGSGGGLGGNGRGGGYAGRTGRGGGRMGGRMSGLGRSDRSSGGGIGGGGGGGGYNNSRQSTSNDEHHEVELWDNTIAQNAEKQNHMQDDAWGDWDNEEYVGSLKDSKVFTTSNLPNQTTASVVSGGLQVVGGPLNDGLSAPPGLESHLGGVPLSPNAGVNDDAITPLPTTPMQYSAALTGGTSVQQQAVQTQQAAAAAAATASSSGLNVNAPQYHSVIADTFTNAANAAANLVQQVQAQQQAQTQLKAAASATLSAEQSQYFNSLTSQNAAAAAAAAGGVVVSSPGGVVVAPQQQQQTQQPQSPLTPQIATYAQSAATAVATGVQYPTTYANVFATTAAGANGNNTNTTPVGLDQQQPMQQVRRPRTKLPPPSKIPSTAVEMPGDSMNNMGYIDVQFGGLDFGTEDSFDVLTDKFNTSVTIDNQGQQVQQQPTQQQQQQLVQDVNSNDYNQSKGGVVAQQTSQTSLNAGLQNPQITDSLNAGYAGQRGAAIPAPQQQQQQQQQVVGNNVGNVGASTLDHLSKNEHVYNQSNVNNSGGYQSAYQTNATIKVANNAYQQSTAAQAYNTNAYGNVQASVGNSYQAQAYGSYQHNAVNSYQQQAANSVPGAVNNGTVNNNNSSQNIPVGGSNSNNATANTNSGYLSTGYPTQQNAYQASQSVYGSTGLSNSSGFAGSSNNSNSQYTNFSTSAKLKDASNTSVTTHFESVTTNNNNNSNNNVSGVAVNAATGPNANSVGVSSNNANNNGSTGSTGSSQSNSNANSVSNANASNANNSVSSAAVSSAVSAVVANKNSGGGVSAVTGATSSGAATAAGASAAAGGSGGMVPNIQMVSQYIQASLPYYQQPVYSYEELPMMQQRVPHVQGYYDLNYTPTSLGAGRDNLGSVAYSTMTDGRFARTDNNSSPVSNQVSSTMSQQAGSSGPMLNVPYYFYGGNMVPGSFQYGTPAIYSQQIPAPNTASGGQFAKPSYNTGYGSTSYDALSQASQDYSKGGYPSSVNPTNKPQNVSNQPPAGTGTDIASSMYGKGHVALNKVNSYEKQNFHSGTPPPFNMPNTQTAGGTSAQPYGMYLPMPATAPHHTNIMHQPIHQMDGRIHNSSRRDSNSTGQRQQTNSQSKSANKQGYSPNYWAGQN